MSRIPEKHTIHSGRSVVFSGPISSIDALFSSFVPATPADKHIDKYISSPIAVVTSLVNAMFANKSAHAHDVNNVTIFRIAAARSVHPDAVRVVAAMIFKQWRDGVVPYIVFTSMHVTDLALPLSDDGNAARGLIVDFRPRIRYDPLHHIAELECVTECVCSDISNYIYLPTVQADATMIRVVISSYGSMYNEGQIKRLRACMVGPVSILDASWVRSIIAMMDGRMTPLLVVKLCKFIVHKCTMLPRGVDIAFAMRREGPLIHFALPRSGHMMVNASSLDKLHDEVAAQDKEAKGRSMCVKCEMRQRVVRCPHCDDLRYCTRDCAVADSELHEKTCRVYIRRNAVQGPRAPGGAIVMKADEQ